MPLISVNCLSFKLNDKQRIHLFIVTAVIKILVQLDINLRVTSQYCQGNSLVISREKVTFLYIFTLKYTSNRYTSLKQRKNQEISTLYCSVYY